MPTETEKQHRPRAGVEAAIRGFTIADWARLHKIGKVFAKGTDWDFEDLLQEAQLRTLRGTRNCPMEVDVMKHLIDTMSSIADAERDKAPNKLPHVSIMAGAALEVVDPPSPDWSAEEDLVFKDGREELLSLFDDDEKAREMVDGIIAGFDTDELKQLTGLNGTTYDSKRTLVRRRLLKHFSRETER
ncbi:hypothetical protein [Bradyrhizobium sp. NP1]|uniref:hypothetical protein n=1 Tax=Bradyrhizobium sp. NP1 TaxID=3049772 RepID=UPI0025A52634|nr:hypothetical protein [Bradyrhizobium sp. NP1]WJR74932.1 hypothetical protein QOU61_19075 [Bradyrhizobium sp. NP1]